MNIALKLRNIKISAKNIMLFYCTILLILPNDFFRISSIYTFVTPDFVSYKWISYYISILYLPLIPCFLFSLRKKPIVSFFKYLVLIVFLDFFVNCFKNDFIIKYKSFELYTTYIVSSLIMYVVFANIKSKEDFVRIVKFYVWTIFITLVLSIILGNTASSGEYANRYSATNLSHNDTGFFLILGICIYLGDKNEKKWISILLFLIGIFATGSRSQLIYLIIVLLVYFLIYFNIKRVLLELLIISCLIILSIVLIYTFYDSMNKLLNLDRFTELLSNFFEFGLNSLLTDKTSGAPRIQGFVIGINMLKNNWLLGNGFSFFSFQDLWQANEGTSAFPHFNIILYWNLLGIACLVPIFMYCKSLFRLIKAKSNYIILGIIILIYNLTNGGMFDSFKSLFFFMLFFSFLLFVSKENYTRGDKI